ncbi:MAG: efflux RND transporter periplasmic adaptor subunit, partial [Candidatus Eisenbacteria bacterium]
MRGESRSRVFHRSLGWAAILLLGALGLAAGCGASGENAGGGEHAEEGHEDEGAHEGETARGPHGGRLFETERTRLELVIVEEGEEGPRYDAYLSAARGRAKPPAGADLKVELRRLGGRLETVTFEPQGERLRSRETVDEPHAFSARASLTIAGRRHEWTFEETEGRIELAPEAIKGAGIDTATAGPASIEVTVEAPGEVRMNAEKVVQVRPRFPGLVREMRKRLGDPVRRGEVLAQVHSNESLSNYAITASLGGTIVSQDVAMGQS